MRTVSFSPANIRESLQKDFICHRINTEGDASAGRSQAHAPNDKPGQVTDGVANQNVQLLFLTPKGEIFHTVSGFRSADALQQELEFSKTMYTSLKTSKDPKTFVKLAHQERARQAVTQTSRPNRSSRIRRSRGGGGGGIRRSQQFDYNFALKFPLLPIKEFEKNPRRLVGYGTSSFSSGSATGGKIGG